MDYELDHWASTVPGRESSGARTDYYGRNALGCRFRADFINSVAPRPARHMEGRGDEASVRIALGSDRGYLPASIVTSAGSSFSGIAASTAA